MKTKIKMLIVAMIFTLSVVGCKKDYPIPEPPQPPQLSISASEITLIVGLSGEIEIKNVTQLIIEPSNTTIARIRYDELAKKLIILSKAPGDVTFNISNKGNTPVTLKVTVKPVVFGLLDTQGQVVFEANYRYQTPSTLHLAPSGTLRKQNYLKIPIEQSLQQGATVSVEYKTTVTEQTLQAKIFLIKNQIIYAIMTDGGYLIFEKK